MTSGSELKYPDLPVSRYRQEILAALRSNQVVVVVGETGSGKTTQLPKMALEYAQERELAGKRVGGRVGCTQPRRIAASSVAGRVAHELGSELGGQVGYQVRFADKVGADTTLKFMTDGILLAETQNDPDLRQYHTIILDEVHERSLNIDFLLGYLKLLLARRPDLRLIISSATMDAGGFSDFFDGAPTLFVEGRGYPVEVVHLPPQERSSNRGNSKQPERNKSKFDAVVEELPNHVARAVDWICTTQDSGDILVFLPGEREIRDVADKLCGMRLPATEVLPLFARLSLAEQQRIFSSASGGVRRRIVLATNVAETSLTIPNIVFVVDSGVARVNRYSAARQVQRLQLEPISQASARQRAGRCGRVRAGVCVRLYEADDWEERAEFTDPEIKRSALASALLRMKDLGLPEPEDFPLLDPPAQRLISEGFRTLREVGAIDKKRVLTPVGKQLARLPLEPRLGRMLHESMREQAMAEVVIIAAGLSLMDPRERPADATQAADAAHAKWYCEESDFIGMLRLWRAVSEFRDGKSWRRNALRRWCHANFVNFMRVIEWGNLCEDLRRSMREVWRVRVPELSATEEQQATSQMIHRSLLAGAPRQFGLWNQEDREYRCAAGGAFAVFPGSALFKRKNRAEWVMGMELVETTRLWMRRAAVLQPEWVEAVAPQLCEYHVYEPVWDKGQGAVYAKERVVCGGLTIVPGRRVHYGRIYPTKARDVMVRDALVKGDLKNAPAFLRHLQDLREQVRGMEQKLRCPDQIWCEDAVVEFLEKIIPPDCCTEKALHNWVATQERAGLADALLMRAEDATYAVWNWEGLTGFPDDLVHASGEYAVYYACDPGAADDGVTLGVHLEQLDELPDFLPSWGVLGNLARRVEVLMRALPKETRSFLQPIAQTAADFAEPWQSPEAWAGIREPLLDVLALFVQRKVGRYVNEDLFDLRVLPPELVTKIWVCDDDGTQLAMGTDVTEIRTRLSSKMKHVFQAQASKRFNYSGLIAWDCGDLPHSTPVGNKLGYVGLVDEGKTVGVRVFEHELEASHNHRLGCVRLALIHHADRVNGLRKKFPLGFEAKFALSQIGVAPQSNLDDLLSLSLELAMCYMGCALPRSSVDWAVAEMNVRQFLFDAGESVARLWSAFVQAQMIRERVAADNRLLAKGMNLLAEDWQRQWAWLTRPHFMRDYGVGNLPNVMRFLAGMQERESRMNHQPLQKELERIKQISPYYDRAATINAPAWAKDDFYAMLEEYRLSLFAPTLAQKGKASPKKLEDALAALSQIC